MFMNSRDAQAKVRQILSQRIGQLETAGRQAHAGAAKISSGCGVIDRCLPGGGYSPGTIVEFLRSGPGSGASLLAMLTARQAMGSGRYLMVVDPQQRFYPPAAVALGLDLDRLIVVHPQQASDAFWAMDQALRSPAVGATWSMIADMDDWTARRLQLAAEVGGGLGVLVRDRSPSPSQPSWAEVQWRVRGGIAAGSEPPSSNSMPPVASWHDARSLDLYLQRCRGGRAGQHLTVAWDTATGQWTSISSQGVLVAAHHEGKAHDTTSSVCLAAELAMPASAAKRPRQGPAGLRAASA
jgi:protein ImuA